MQSSAQTVIHPPQVVFLRKERQKADINERDFHVTITVYLPLKSVPWWFDTLDNLFLFVKAMLLFLCDFFF